MNGMYSWCWRYSWESEYIQPYMFEPPAQANNEINAEEGSEESEDENDRLDRRQSTIW